MMKKDFKNEIYSKTRAENAFILDLERKVYFTLLQLLKLGKYNTKNVHETKNEKLKEIQEKINFVVGFSGGPDSTFLITVLDKINKGKIVLKRNQTNILKDKINITAVHINHMIRNEAEFDEELAKNYCKEKEIEFISEKIDIKSYAKQNKISEELLGREERYKIFTKISKFKQAEKNIKTYILTAHISQDTTETMLMNLLRGTGKHGLKGILPRTINLKYSEFEILRPIFNISKQDILKYLQINNIKYAVDKTNFETDYTRNKIRNIILPEIEKMGYDINNSLFNLSMIIKEEEEYLEKEIDKKYHQLIMLKETEVNEIDELEKKDKLNKINTIYLDYNRTIKEEKYILKRIIIKAIEELELSFIDISTINLNDIYNLITSGITGKKLSPKKGLLIEIVKKQGKKAIKILRYNY